MVYRELLLCRKMLGTYLITTVIFTMFPILAILSLRCGNLAMLPETIVADIRSHNDLMLTLYGGFCPCMLVFCLAESTKFDIQIQWDRFRRSTPVKPGQMALAKYVWFLILLLFSVAVSVAAMGLCHGLLGSSMTVTDFALIMALLTICSVLTVISQVCIMLFRSVDKGMLAMIGCAAAVILLLPEKWTANLSTDRLLGAVEALLPLTPVVLVGILLLGTGLTACIYARREK